MDHMGKQGMNILNQDNLSNLNATPQQTRMKSKTTSMLDQREKTQWAWSSNPKTSILIKGRCLKPKEIMQQIRPNLKQLLLVNSNSALLDQVMVKAVMIQINLTFTWAYR